VHLDPSLLRGCAPPGGEPRERFGRGDEALRWLMASDRLVGDEVARALVEVKEGRLYHAHGHARWSAYLSAFVPLTARWAQHEMRRVRELAEYPGLAADYEVGRISRSHLRVVLRVVRPETEALWRERAASMTVRQLERLAGQAREEGERLPAVEPLEEPAPARVRVVTAPPAVAGLVAQAVELARKVEGYQIGVGQAVAIMAMETAAGLPAVKEPAVKGQEADAEIRETAAPQFHDGCLPGDRQALVGELGPEWEELHRLTEEVTRRWVGLPWDLPSIVFEGAPAGDAEPHERVVFWSSVQGRLDAVRGRLLRISRETGHTEAMGFAGLGQYVRERMGLGLREAQDLIRLDRALVELPVAFRMYAAGRLGKRAAWAVSRVADRRTDREWTRYALTHTLRLLEAVVEAAVLKREVDPAGWRASGGLPPGDVSYAAAVRACSFLGPAGEAGEPGTSPAGGGESGAETSRNGVMVRIRLPFDEEQRAVFEQTSAMLRAAYGPERPEWWCLAVMARHFIDCYEQADRDHVRAPLRRAIWRRVIERDGYTCLAAECRLRSHLEWNQVSLCATHHRYLKHAVGSLSVRGVAPDDLEVTMGERVYRNDAIVLPTLPDGVLDEDPWETPAWETPGPRAPALA